MRRLFGVRLYRLLVVFFVASFVGSVYAGAPATAYAQAPNPQEIYVQSITYGGTGCPQGSVGSSFSNDRKSFTLIFDSFVASAGPGVPITESRKNCQLNINIHVPQGFTYAIHTFDYRGYVMLPDGATAEQQATYSVADGEARSSKGSRFKGPVSNSSFR